MTKIINVIFILLFASIVTYDLLKKTSSLIFAAYRQLKQLDNIDDRNKLYKKAWMLILTEIRNYMVLQGVLIGAGFYNELWSK
jgi:hypothetical protein